MTDDRILEKKLDHYATESIDFEAEGELTVTVTLNEYRSLVRDSVEKQYIKREKNSLAEEVEKLKAKLADNGFSVETP